jgi:hypothetical protein
MKRAKKRKYSLTLASFLQSCANNPDAEMEKYKIYIDQDN